MTTVYHWRTKPYKHQVRAIKKLIHNGYGGALLMDPRTGKTKTCIDYACILAQRGRIRQVVVICPPRVMDVWVEEFHTHATVPVHTHVWDAKARKAPLPPVGPVALNVVIVNYEAFSTPGRRLKSGRRSTASGRFKVRRQIRDWIQGSALCILDESHKIASPSGKASTLIVTMRRMFAYRVIATGTPVRKARRAHDAYMQWKFLNPDRFADLPTFEDFKNHYGRWLNQDGYQKWLRPRNIEEFHSRIHADAFAVKREDCFDLPASSDQIVHIRLNKETLRIYDEMAEQMVAEIKEGEITEASIAIVKTLRLAQITSGIATTTDETLVRIGTEKLDVLSGLLEEFSDHEEKVVIPARFRADLDAILRLCKRHKLKTFQIRGGVKREEVTRDLRLFKEFDGPAVYIVQPGAASLGIDMAASPRMVWYSLTNSWVDYTQTCDRIALSPVPRTYTYLLAKGTVDELMFRSLQEDIDMGRYILTHPEALLRR